MATTITQWFPHLLGETVRPPSANPRIFSALSAFQFFFFCVSSFSNYFATSKKKVCSASDGEMLQIPFILINIDRELITLFFTTSMILFAGKQIGGSLIYIFNYRSD